MGNIYWRFKRKAVPFSSAASRILTAESSDRSNVNVELERDVVHVDAGRDFEVGEHFEARRPADRHFSVSLLSRVRVFESQRLFDLDLVGRSTQL